jgi:two-component system nitrogen regulation response regulator NtrX
MDSQSGPRILVVDDEPEVLQVCSRVLSRAGYEVRAAGDAVEARQYLIQERYDLVILDIYMPYENGISLLKYAHTLDPALPAILITGYPEVSTVLDSVRLHVFEYLCKPFTAQDLLAAVKSGLQGSGEAEHKP